MSMLMTKSEIETAQHNQIAAQRNEAHATNVAAKALGLGLAGMTQDRWMLLTIVEKMQLVDNSGLTKHLLPYEGCRVEVVDKHTGGKRRFWVGRSSGWKPCHTELKLRTSRWGMSADWEYESVRLITTRQAKYRRR